MAADKENPLNLPLYKMHVRKNKTQRALDVTLLLLLISLLIYRLASLKDHGFLWLLALLCESWFTFTWLLVVSTKWSPAHCETYLDNLQQTFPEWELPAVDMFVTTADPVAEPPIITVNTVLSLLAVDYPADKLACYVSDDGCSPLTFYTLQLAAEFAQLWVPFCKRHDVQIRAPFRYFAGEAPPSSPGSLQKEWKTMKDEYDKLGLKIDEAARRGAAPYDLTGDLAVFADTKKLDHPTIVKVIWENKKEKTSSSWYGVPHLVYISREKRPKHPHHYKAGAMNVLTRVSGVMTNAAYMLNVDCDMYANNAGIIRYAMCLLLDPLSRGDKEVAFVQCPQAFYDGPKDDPFGNQLVVLYRYLGQGVAGIQGPFYGGTCCFHRRKVIYGQSPHDSDATGVEIAGDQCKLQNEFGGSTEFIKCARDALNGITAHPPANKSLSESLETAFEVAGSTYENNSRWGTKVGWLYGSATEDILTGMMIHAKGWKSSLITPDPTPFLGCAPPGGPASMTQQKRWAAGLLEILVTSSSNRPMFGSGRLQFRQRLAYLWVCTWGLRSVPELCYAMLPAYCIITGSHFLPKVHEPAMLIPVAIFAFYNFQTLIEYIGTGMSIRAWWNNHRMARVTTSTAWFFGFLSALLKLMGLSEIVFEITRKDQAAGGTDNNDKTSFTFDDSPIFVPGTALLLLHLATLSIIPLKLLSPPSSDSGIGAGEIFCSVWIVLCFWPFLKGLFGRGKYGIPASTIFKSAALALVFGYFCKKNPQ